MGQSNAWHAIRNPPYNSIWTVKKWAWKHTYEDINLKEFEAITKNPCEHSGCFQSKCAETLWCDTTIDSSCTSSSCPIEIPDCDSLRSNVSKVQIKQNLTKLEDGTNYSNSKEDWVMILVVVGALMTLILLILLILFCKGKLHCCNFKKTPTDARNNKWSWPYWDG